jgi:hypothetical protein
MLKWTFVFEDNSIGVDIKSSMEDTRLYNAMTTPEKLVYLEIGNQYVWFNLAHVKYVIREDGALPKLETTGQGSASPLEDGLEGIQEPLTP